MTARPDPDVTIAAWLHEEAPVAAPERLLTASRDRIRSTHQRRVLWPVWSTRSKTRTTLAAAVVVAVVALGSAFFVIQRGQPAIIGPVPSASPSPSASQPAVIAPIATPTAEVSPSPDPTSLKLTWAKVALDRPFEDIAWVVDRFVMIDDAGAVSTSTDGANWQVLQPGDPDPGYAQLLRGKLVSWGDDIVGWWNPEDGPDIAGKPPVTARDILRIVRPPAEPRETTPWKGRIGSLAVGPAGIVAQVHSHLDWDAWVASKLGDDWVSRYKGVDLKDGILEITMKRGRGLKVVWADQGFEPGDYQDAGFGWYSPDGEQWTLMPAPGPSPDGDGGLGFVTGFGDVVGVSDGFIAHGNDGIWHSSDGLTWRNLGHPEVDSSDASALLPWKGGALLTDGVGTFDFWTSQGPTELPVVAELPATWKQGNRHDAKFATGPLGLIAVQKDDHQKILFTRDGVAWDIQAMPAAMEADHTSFYGWANAVVGDQSVLVVLRSGTDVAPISSLWLGTPAP